MRSDLVDHLSLVMVVLIVYEAALTQPISESLCSHTICWGGTRTSYVFVHLRERRGIGHLRGTLMLAM